MDETSKHQAKADKQPNSSGLVSGLAFDNLHVNSRIPIYPASWSECTASFLRLYNLAAPKGDMSSKHNGQAVATAQKIAMPRAPFGCFPMFLFLPLHYCIDRKSPDQASPVKEVGICRSSSTAVYLPSFGTHLLS